jgi:hypothetical protein
MAERRLIVKRKVCLIVAFIFFADAVPGLAQFYGPDQEVQGHFRHDGNYVQPYHRTMPDQNPFNNYSTQGNINPYTGQTGTVNPCTQHQPNNLFQNPSPYGYQGQKRRRSWP